MTAMPELTLITNSGVVTTRTSAAPRPESQRKLESALDAIYGFAEHMEQELAGQFELAAATRREHDDSHPNGWGVCEREICRLAAGILP